MRNPRILPYHGLWVVPRRLGSTNTLPEPVAEAPRSVFFHVKGYGALDDVLLANSNSGSRARTRVSPASPASWSLVCAHSSAATPRPVARNILNCRIGKPQATPPLSGVLILYSLSGKRCRGYMLRTYGYRFVQHPSYG